MKLPLNLVNIFNNNIILDADENILEIKDNRKYAEEIVNKVNTFDVLDKELYRLENKEKRLKKEMEELKKSNDISIKSWVDLKREYANLLSENQELKDRVEEVEDVNERILNANYSLEGYIRISPR